MASGVGSSWWTGACILAVAGLGLTPGGPTVQLVGIGGQAEPIVAGEVLVWVVTAGEVLVEMVIVGEVLV